MYGGGYGGGMYGGGGGMYGGGYGGGMLGGGMYGRPFGMQGARRVWGEGEGARLGPSVGGGRRA